MKPATIQPHTGSLHALRFHHDVLAGVGVTGNPGVALGGGGGGGGGKMLMAIGLSSGRICCDFGYRCKLRARQSLRGSQCASASGFEAWRSAKRHACPPSATQERSVASVREGTDNCQLAVVCGKGCLCICLRLSIERYCRCSQRTNRSGSLGICSGESGLSCRFSFDVA